MTPAPQGVPDELGRVAQHRGFLCTPFPKSSRPAGENEDLKKLIAWIKGAAQIGNIDLRTIAGEYDSDQQIVERIFREVERADLVVTVVREANASAFFEAGYATGIGQPLLYVVREGEDVPFDARGVEYFAFRELDQDSERELSEAMLRCMHAGQAHNTLASSLSQLRRHGTALTLRDNLYAACLAHALGGITAWVRSWQPNSFEVRAQSLLDVGTFIMSAIQKGGFATEYYSGHASWSDYSNELYETDYFVATRNAVGRGLSISRIYVVDSEQQIHEEAFRTRVWADSAAGIDTRYILAGALPDPRAKDFGLWDDELLCEVEYMYTLGDAPRLFRCRYWDDDYHVNTARGWRDSLERNAKPCPDLPSESALLADSAGAMPDALAACCEEVGGGKVDCSAYHVHWQDLRRRGLVSTPSWHADFYAPAFRAWSDAARSSGRTAFTVLVSGLADYAMLYWVAQSIDRAVRQQCTFHVVDICGAPLISCRWLERQLRARSPSLELKIEYRRANLLTERLPPEAYDLIVSDAFWTRFQSREEKMTVLRNWTGALVRDGTIVTTTRVREGSSDLDQAARDEFVARGVNRHGDEDIGLNPSIARAYADYISSYPFTNEAELRRFLFDVRDEATVHDLSFAVLKEREMVTANYARIVMHAT